MPLNQSYADKHYDRVLTNFSVAFFTDQTKYVSTSVFPAIPVRKASDKYTTYPKGAFARSNAPTELSEETKANRITYTTGKDSYSVDEHGLRIFISNKKRANVDAEQNLDFEATQVVTEHLLLARERDWSERFMTTGVWTQDVTGTAGGTGDGEFQKWDASSGGGTPIEDFTKWCREFQERTHGIRPNKILMSRDVWDVLKNHEDILGRIDGGATTENPAIVRLRFLAGLLEVGEIRIMEVTHNVAADGVVDANNVPVADIQFMKKNFAFLYYQEPNSTIGLYKATAGVNFVWNEYIPHTDTGGMGAGPYMRRYVETPALRGEWLEGIYCSDFKVISPDCGTFINAPITA